jgi:hypothetical protein
LNINQANYTFTKLNTVNYTRVVVEGSLTTFNSSFYLNSTPISVYLVYNNISYTPTIITDGDYYNFVNIITTPTVSTTQNISFYYLINSSSLIQSDTYNQTVVNVDLLTNCNSSGYPFLNFSNYNEETLIGMVGTVDFFFSLTDNGGNVIQTINSTNTGTNITICSSVNLSNSGGTKYSLQLRYYLTDGSYAYKTYNIQNSDIINLPVTIPLYFLNKGNSTQFTIKYIDFDYFIHPGALVQIQRQYLNENTYRVVEIPIIISNGLSYGSFNTNNIKYKIIVTENGVILDTFEDVFPVCQNVVLGTCELNLRGEQSTPSTTNGDFTYTLTKSNQSLIMTYIIPSGTPRTITFATNQNSRFLSDITSCNTTVFGSGGTVTCGYNNTLGDSLIDVSIINSDGTNLYGQVHISEDLSGFYLLNNYVIGFVLLLSLGLIFISSGVMMVIISVVGLMFLGLIFLLRGFDVTTVVSSIMWLIIGAGLVVYKLAQKEEKT